MTFEIRMIRKMFICLLILLLCSCGFSRSETNDEPEKEAYPPKEEYVQILTGIKTIDKQGNIVLDISVQKLNETGYEAGDVIIVTINDNNYDMPIGLMINEVSSKEQICLFESESGAKDIVKLASKNESFFSKAGIGEVELISEEPGYKLHWADDMDMSLSVSISMKEKQGHNDDYPTDEHVYERKKERGEYPHLSDEEFANFREVDTAGVGDNVLYRSSSPVNPKLNRNLEADKAISKAEIKTVFNMADYPGGTKIYDGYNDSYYKNCDVIALNMSTWFNTEEFGHRLAEGFRFMIEHEGPYLIHCTEGKDRTGFAIAIIECLMGAEADEVVSDYMKTFYNYYGVKLGSLVYNNIAERNIKKDLSTAFHIESLFADVDLSICAEAYLIEIGMSEEEIDLLKEKLRKER